MTKLLPFIAQTECEAWNAFLIASLLVCPDYKAANKVVANLYLSAPILGDSNFEVIHKHIFAIGRNVGYRALIDGSIARINEQDKETLFTYCVKVVFSDANLTTLKTSFINYIAEALRISKHFLQATTLVMWSHSQKNMAY